MGWYLGTNFNDNIIGTAGTDFIFGLDGDDLITGGAGADTLSGGAGTDALVYIGSNAGVTVDLTAGTAHGGHAEGDVFSGFENIIGSSYDDTLTGDGGANVLSGGGGSDTLYGAWGNDSLYGGAGSDWLMGGVGADYLDGGSGSDHAVYTGGFLGVTVNLLIGAGSGGEAEGDTYVSIEHVNGSQGADLIFGNLSSNTLSGAAGNDVIYGLAGDDGLIGGIGDDTLVGGAGSDYLSGEQGSDTYFYFAASDSPANPFGAFVADTIASFDDGGVWNDVINLATIDANETIGGDQAFFLDNGNGVTEAGELFIITNFIEDGDDTPVTIFYADVTGDALPDFGVKFSFVVDTLDASDFVL